MANRILNLCITLLIATITQQVFSLPDTYNYTDHWKKELKDGSVEVTDESSTEGEAGDEFMQTTTSSEANFVNYDYKKDPLSGIKFPLVEMIQFAQAKIQINQARNQIEQLYSQIDQLKSQIEKAKSQIEQAKNQMREGKKQMEQAKSQMKSQLIDMKAAFKKMGH